MRKTLLITYILVLALTMQGKNEHPVRSALVSQGDSCMAEHDSQHAIGFYQQHLNTHPGDLPVLRATECAATTRKPSPVWTVFPKTASTTRT